ncbi:MAG: glycosyl hydrolase family 8 [Polyangiaceae bacterium]
MYTFWKQTFVNCGADCAATSGLRVRDPLGPPVNRTVSEGIAYGMLISVYMGDKTTFDGLWTYAQAHGASATGGLMAWQQDSTGANVNGDSHSASDADEDMAFALAMASKQWTGGTYGSAASAMIGGIKANDIQNNEVRDGNYSSGIDHPDYAAPDYYKVFATLGNDASWTTSIYPGEYTVLTGAEDSTSGLIMDSSGAYDVVRAPWRAGLDYCWTGSSSAKSFLSKSVTWLAQYAAAHTDATYNGVDSFKMPYTAGGNFGTTNNACLTGPIGVAFMTGGAADQTYVDGSWEYLHKLVSLATSSSPNYFDGTLGLLAMLSMSGNMLDFTNLP